MLNLSQNPIFWPNQAGFIVEKSHPNIFIGAGIATKTQLSQAVPFDIIGFLLSAEFIKRQIPHGKIFLLIANQHAWLANNFNRNLCQKSANNLLKTIQKIIKNLKLKNWQISLASQIFPNALPQSYEDLEKRDVTHFFNHHLCGIKVGWSFSLTETDHKTDESHFDKKIPMFSIFTKPGITNNPNKPQESPYICTDPITRIILVKNEGIIEKLNPAMKNHLNRITMLFEQLIKPFPNKTPLENKIKTIINQICH